MSKPLSSSHDRPCAQPGLPLLPLWTGAAMLVLAFHGAVAWAIGNWQPNTHIAIAHGAEPIMIELAPAAAVTELPPQEQFPPVQPEEKPPEIAAPLPEAATPELERIEGLPPPTPRSLPKPRRETAPQRRVERQQLPKPATATEMTQASTDTAPAAVPSASAMAAWQNSINSRIARAAQALTVRSGGTASVIFSVSPSGQVLSVRLGQSSGDGQQDADIVAMIRHLNPFPSPPPGTVAAKTLRVPINFKR